MKLNITKSFGEKLVLNSFCLASSGNEKIAIMGVSGCGKTTLLNIMSGLLPYEGKIIDAYKRVSSVFQTERLIPSATVEKNLEFVLSGVIKNKNERREKIDDILKEVELFNEKKSYPYQLSGGMAQRVALARAFLYPSDVLLLDEPWKALDIRLKSKMLKLFVELWQKSPRPVFFITHDVDEALLLADKVVVMKGGKNAAEYPLPDGDRVLSDPALVKAKAEILTHFSED